MAYDEVRPGDRFSIAYRTAQDGEDQWHLVAERADPHVAEKLFVDVIADSRAEGAQIGSRWRLCHHRSGEIIHVLDDRTLALTGLVLTPTDSK